jgi:hypothetical protein
MECKFRFVDVEGAEKFKPECCVWFKEVTEDIWFIYIQFYDQMDFIGTGGSVDPDENNINDSLDFELWDYENKKRRTYLEIEFHTGKSGWLIGTHESSLWQGVWISNEKYAELLESDLPQARIGGEECESETESKN